MGAVTGPGVRRGEGQGPLWPPRALSSPFPPPHNFSSHSAGEGAPWRWSPRCVPPQRAFVAIRIPMLLFLTGHWWLYRQVLRWGCNYPGRAWCVPSLLPTPAARVLPALPPLSKPLPSPQSPVLQGRAGGAHAPRCFPTHEQVLISDASGADPTPRPHLSYSPRPVVLIPASRHPSLKAVPNLSAPRGSCRVSPSPESPGPRLEALEE